MSPTMRTDTVSLPRPAASYGARVGAPVPRSGPLQPADALCWTPSLLRSVLVAPLMCQEPAEREATRRVLLEVLSEVDEPVLEAALTPGLADALLSELGLGGLDTRWVARLGAELLVGLRPIRRLLAREASRQARRHRSGFVVRSLEGHWCSASVAASDLLIPEHGVAVLHLDFERPRVHSPLSQPVRAACSDAEVEDSLVTVRTHLGAGETVSSESWRFALEVSLRLIRDGLGPLCRWALQEGPGLGEPPPTDIRVVVHRRPAATDEVRVSRAPGPGGLTTIHVDDAREAARILGSLRLPTTA